MQEYDHDSDGFLSVLECFCLLPELEKSLPQKNTKDENMGQNLGPKANAPPGTATSKGKGGGGGKSGGGKSGRSGSRW